MCTFTLLLTNLSLWRKRCGEKLSSFYRKNKLTRAQILAIVGPLESILTDLQLNSSADMVQSLLVYHVLKSNQSFKVHVYPILTRIQYHTIHLWLFGLYMTSSFNLN